MSKSGCAFIRRLDLSGFGFEEVSLVGRGHSASAQLVRETETGEHFLAKCVSLADLTEHDQAFAHQEVFLLQALRHPLIVAYHDSFLVEGQDVLVIVMEYCDGGDLRMLINEKAKSGEHFSEDRVMTWFAQIVLALQFIHSEKVLHRDLKTSNIFLSKESYSIKLGDFGISRVLEGTADAAVTMVGTPYYMSPEVCRNEPYSWKSDVWSLGCVLYELCMLKHAFASSSLLGLVYKIVSDHYEPIPSFYSKDRGPAAGAPCPALRLVPVRGAAGARWAVAHSEGVVKTTTGALLLAAPPDEAAGPHQPRAEPPSGGETELDLAFASFDDSGDGALSPEAMQTALGSLQLGLSQEEVSVLVESLLPSPGAKVPLSSFEENLVEANTSLEAVQLEVWARQLLEPMGSQVAIKLRDRDVLKSGMLPAMQFREVLTELVPDTSHDQVDVLELLADKNTIGDIDYMPFADAFAEAPLDPCAPVAFWPKNRGPPPPPPPLPGPATPNSCSLKAGDGEIGFFTGTSADPFSSTLH
eukprot:CAMPEP_0179237378 /NCGR_PEP_ID=MMETSP0797-20121207/14408_1 /TAXON_ID=47934 /ORGANISM="Dinophysis acuminata, Strain DAEP01" /LENGTH=526 /DNA_ID=CAMNT_0020944655 /DNA_START=136 /DNA_END=1718 /DNA_ORIENTATION=-